MAAGPVVLIVLVIIPTPEIYVVDKARKENIANISRPLDGMHKMQPLDVIFMAPFKHIMHKRLKRG